jgi:hypothetical protein
MKGAIITRRTPKPVYVTEEKRIDGRLKLVHRTGTTKTYDADGYVQYTKVKAIKNTETKFFFEEQIKQGGDEVVDGAFEDTWKQYSAQGLFHGSDVHVEIAESKAQNEVVEEKTDTVEETAQVETTATVTQSAETPAPTVTPATEGPKVAS